MLRIPLGLRFWHKGPPSKYTLGFCRNFYLRRFEV
jgi:hypothetical protein